MKTTKIDESYLIETEIGLFFYDTITKTVTLPSMVRIDPDRDIPVIIEVLKQVWREIKTL